MIVQPRDGQLLLVRQTDHAAISGELAAHWGDGTFWDCPEPRASVLLATVRHDDGWRAYEERPRVNPATRRPYQFTEMPVQEHIPFYREGIDAVARDDPYAGLLVSMHLSGLYRKRYGLDPRLSLERLAPEVRPYVETHLEQLAEQQRRLKEQMRHDGVVPAEALEELAVWTNYRLLQVYDLLSLFLCLGPPRRGVIPHTPVNSGRPDVELQLTPLGPERLGVHPYPFDQVPLVLTVPARVVPDRDYAYDDDFRAALAQAPDVGLRWELVPVA